MIEDRHKKFGEVENHAQVCPVCGGYCWVQFRVLVVVDELRRLAYGVS